jgi:hypothetical protein
MLMFKLQHIFEAVRHSLRRLQLDYVDVLQCKMKLFDLWTTVLSASHQVIGLTLTHPLRRPCRHYTTSCKLDMPATLACRPAMLINVRWRLLSAFREAQVAPRRLSSQFTKCKTTRLRTTSRRSSQCRTTTVCFIARRNARCCQHLRCAHKK